MPVTAALAERELELVELLFVEEQGAWRVFAGPTVLHGELSRLFDRHGELFPVLVDWDDFERWRSGIQANIRKHTTRAGSIEIEARGHAAELLANWLLSAVGSGVRAPR